MVSPGHKAARRPGVRVDHSRRAGARPRLGSRGYALDSTEKLGRRSYVTPWRKRAVKRCGFRPDYLPQCVNPSPYVHC